MESGLLIPSDKVVPGPYIPHGNGWGGKFCPIMNGSNLDSTKFVYPLESFNERWGGDMTRLQMKACALLYDDYSMVSLWYFLGHRASGNSISELAGCDEPSV